MFRTILRGTTFLVLTSLSVFDAGAQTRFEWPKAGIDAAQYKTLEDCLAITARLSDSIARSRPVFRDTAVWDPTEALEPVPERVRTIAQQCGAKFQANSIPLDAHGLTELATELFLIAGRDQDAAALVTRTLSSIPPESTQKRAHALTGFTSIYLHAQPSRISAVDSLLELLSRESFDEVPALNRLMFQLRLFEYAKRIGDTVRAERYARDVSQMVPKLSPEETSSETYRSAAIEQRWFAVVNFLKRDELDSLIRLGTAEFTKQMKEMARLIGLSSLTEHFGDPHPPITGNFVVLRSGSNKSSSCDVRASADSLQPLTYSLDTNAKVRLVVFFQRDGFPRWERFAVFRRIAQEFPELDITLVTRTVGWFGAMAPPTPLEEARMICRWAFEFHKLPGSLVVEQTPFFRVPGIDRRRIDGMTPNGDAWLRAYHKGVVGWLAFIIDGDGVVVRSMDFSRTNESGEKHFIRLLLENQRRGKTP